MHGPQELSVKFVMAPEQEVNLIGRGVRLPEWGCRESPGPRCHLASFKIQTVLREPLEALSFPHGSHRTKVTSVRKPTRQVLPMRFGRA